MKTKNKESSFTAFYRRNKLIIWILIIILVVFLCIKFIGNKKDESNNNDNKSEIKDIKVSISPKSDVMVGVGYSAYLFAMVENVPDATCRWTTSDENIASIYNGNVIGKKSGKVTITAIYERDGKEYKDTKEITIVEGNTNVSLKEIDFPKGELYMPLNSAYRLNLIISPSNALITSKTYKSSNENVVTVTNDGVVESHKEGHALVTVNVNDKLKKSIDVYVGSDYSKPEIVTGPDSISIIGNNLSIKVDSQEKLSYVLAPAGITFTNLKWISSDPNVVTISQNGVIKGISVGKATISLSSINGKRDDINVNVVDKIVEITDIKVDKTQIEMQTGKTEVIIPSISPSNATNKVLNFTSSNNDVLVVSVNSDRQSVTLLALKEGSSTVTITGGKVSKTITVTVKGENITPKEDEEGKDTTIKVRSNKNNIAYTYEAVKNIGVSGTTTLTITLNDGMGKVKYCINKYGATPCTPNIDMYSTGTVSIPSGGIYVLKVKKYDKQYNEVGSTSVNYVDGALTYYINTQAIVNIEPKQYEIKGAYFNSTYSKAYPLNLNDKVEISLLDNQRYLMVCYTTNTSCTPTTKVTSTYKMTLNKTGIWRVFVIEYDNNGNKIGNTETYYAYVKSDTSNNDNNSNNNQETSQYKIRSSNLKMNTNTSVGKYLSVYVESDKKFSQIRFCYRVVSKGSNETCNLDLTSSSVILHNGGSYYHPKESLKTYYGSFTEISSKTFNFDIDGLDELYNNGDTNKDVILSYAVASKINNKMTYSYPIKVRMNMTKKNGTESFWSLGFIE